MINRILILLLFFGLLYPQTTTIAVMELEGKEVSQSEASIITDRLRSELFNSGHYNVLERGMMDDILKEQGFQQTGCTSSECAVEVGNMLGVQQMVGGSIGKIGSMYTVSARIIDVETGGLLKSANYDHTGSIEQLVTKGMKQVVAQLLGTFDSHDISRSGENGDASPELKMKANPDQTDNSYVISFIYLQGISVFQAAKFLDERTGVGFGYSNFSWEGKSLGMPNRSLFPTAWTDSEYPSYGDTINVSQHQIGATFYYYLRNQKSILFNPSVLLNLGIRFVKRKNISKDLSGNISYLAGATGLMNRVHINRSFGITFGFIINNWTFHDFKENDELYGVKSGIGIDPFLTLDISVQFPKK